MKSYFAGQCGAVLGGLVAAVAVIAADKLCSEPETEKEAIERDRNARVCILAGAAIGGIAAIIAVNK